MSSEPSRPATPRPRAGAWLTRRLPEAALGILLMGAGVAASGSAWGYFPIHGEGVGSATTGTLTAPGNVVASATTNSGTVPLTWTAASTGTGQSLQGYYVQRVRTSDQLVTAACGTSPTSLTTTPSCTDLLVPDGTYRYRVVAVLGSWTAVATLSNSVNVVNDSTLPVVTVSSTSPPANANGYFSTSPVTVNLSTSPGSAGSPISTLTSWIGSGARSSISASSASVPVSGNGAHVVSFYATDTAGRQSGTSTHTVRIDTVAPSAPAAPTLTAATDTGPSSTDGITKITTPTFTGTAEADSTVDVYAGSTLVGTGIATGGTYTVSSSTLVAGTHAITVRATDLAGNSSSASAARTIVIDTTAPAAPSIPVLAAASDSGRLNNDKITRVTTPTFTGTTETSATVTLLDGNVPSGSGMAASTSWSVATTALSDGAHTISARATDLAGNTSIPSTGSAITIDTLAPSAPSKPALSSASDSGSSSTDGITRITTPTFSGISEKRALVSLQNNGATLTISGAVNSGNYSLTSPALANNTHPITTTATDTAGNVSPASTVTVVTVDTVAPVTSTPAVTAASDTGIAATDRITRLTTPTVTGTSEAGAIVTVLAATAQIGTGTAVGGNYSIRSTALTAGTHSLSARATDLAGNTGTASTSITLTIDTTAPTVRIDQATGQVDPTPASPINFTAVFSEVVYGFTATDVILSGSAGATTATLSGSGPTFTIAVSGMTNTGLVTATIPAAGVTDTAGNTNTASTSTDGTVTYTKP